MRAETSKTLTSAIIRHVRLLGGQSFSLDSTPGGQHKLRRKSGMPTLKISYQGLELFVEVRAKTERKSQAAQVGRYFLAHNLNDFIEWFEKSYNHATQPTNEA